MQRQIKPTKTWDELADTIEPKDYAAVQGMSVEMAREVFKRRDFPRSPRNWNKTKGRQRSSKIICTGVISKTKY